MYCIEHDVKVFYIMMQSRGTQKMSNSVYLDSGVCVNTANNLTFRLLVYL